MVPGAHNRQVDEEDKDHKKEKNEDLIPSGAILTEVQLCLDPVDIVIYHEFVV